MRLTWHNLWCITAERVYSLPISREEEEIVKQMAELISGRSGFTPVVIKDDEDSVGIITVHDGPSLPRARLLRSPVGNDAGRCGHLS